MQTISIKSTEAKRKWWVIDATDKVLGRLATLIADTLRGKNKPDYTPNADTGDFVVVINAEKIRLTGNKMHDKIYYHHTGFPGGIKSISAEKLLVKHPDQLIQKAVQGMLPKNKLSNDVISKLKVYAGPEHPHTAQRPEPLVIRGKAQ